jgi:DNA modification methylase
MSDLAPYYSDDFATLFNGDCLEVTLPDNSIDSIITDPPYGLEFMGKAWDRGVPGVEFWQHFLQAAKPGAPLLAFGGTRTFHRMACAIEDAGWEIRDCLMWLYGTGFPKSHDISAAIDKEAGFVREKIRYEARPVTSGTMSGSSDTRPWIEKSRELGYHEKAGKTPVCIDAQLWQGYGTALKPGWEPIIYAVKPIEGTYAENARKWGVAGLNIDGARIASDESTARPSGTNQGIYGADDRKGMIRGGNELGRWPANVVHDGGEEVLAEFAKYGETKSKRALRGLQNSGRHGGIADDGANQKEGTNSVRGYDDSGSVARFFYAAKASKAERDAGLETLPVRDGAGALNLRSDAHAQRNGEDTKQRNFHPTVKPLALMEWLCKLTKTPTGGIVFDPFCGSGTTLVAAKKQGRECVGIELSPEYCEIIAARVRATKPN